MPLIALSLFASSSLASDGEAFHVAPTVESTNLPPTSHRDPLTVLRHRQYVLSGLWAFASLNYLYADLVPFMNRDSHLEFHTGEVNGVRLSDGFLLGATAYMQVPLSMVVLSSALSPKASRVLNVTVGITSTVIQGATLFVGKPTPAYVLSSIVEMGTTAFIAAYAWKGLKPPKTMPVVHYDRRRRTAVVGVRLTVN